MIKLIRWALPAALVGVAAASSAQQVFLGPEVGVFIPADSKLRDALGSQWVSFGFGSLRTEGASTKKMAWNWEATTQNKNGSKVFMGAVSYGYLLPLGQGQPDIPGVMGQAANFQPYAALRAGGSYIDFAVNTDGGRESGKRFGFNANAELGVLIGKKLNIAARYDLNPSHNGLNFSGFTLSARYGLFRF